MKQTTQYKNTAIGKIPIDWEVRKLGDLATYKSSSLSINKLEANFGQYPLYGAGKIIQNIDFYQQKEKYISIIKDGAGVGRVLKCTPLSSVVGTMSYIQAKPNTDFDYLYFIFESISFDRYITGSTIPHIYFKDYSNEKIPFPPLPEQQKIAKVLSTWDKAIQETDAIIEKLKKRNKALANKLFMDNDKKPNQKPIMQIVDRIKNSFTPEENTLYKQIGIRSHAKGLFYKEAVTGKSLGNKSVFWIEPNCFIVNIVFAWERAIGKTTDADIGFIASHRFPMYRPKAGILNLDYLLYFFKSLKGRYLLELASPGGAGRNKTLGQTEFLKLKIPVPSIEEQIRLVNVLDTATKELQQYQQKLSNLKLQKKGLMQQLLTGKTRIV